MSIAPSDEEKLKSLFKAAIIEVLEERGDFLREAVEEAIEDIALARAMDEAASGANVSRDEVFEILEDDRKEIYRYFL